MNFNSNEYKNFTLEFELSDKLDSQWEDYSDEITNLRTLGEDEAYIFQSKNKFKYFEPIYSSFVFIHSCFENMYSGGDCTAEYHQTFRGMNHDEELIFCFYLDRRYFDADFGDIINFLTYVPLIQTNYNSFWTIFITEDLLEEHNVWSWDTYIYYGVLFLLLVFKFYLLFILYYFYCLEFINNIENNEDVGEAAPDEENFYEFDWSPSEAAYIKKKFGPDLTAFELYNELSDISEENLVDNCYNFDQYLDWLVEHDDFIYSKFVFLFLIWFKFGYETNLNRVKGGGILSTRGEKHSLMDMIPNTVLIREQLENNKFINKQLIDPFLYFSWFIKLSLIHHMFI